MRPQASELCEPSVDFHERLRLQAVHAVLSVDARFDEAGVAQHLQVLRHRRLRHPQRALDLADSAFLRREQPEDVAAVRLSEDLERFHTTYIRISAYARQGT